MTSITHLELIIYIILAVGSGYFFGGKYWEKFLMGEFK